MRIVLDNQRLERFESGSVIGAFRPLTRSRVLVRHTAAQTARKMFYRRLQVQALLNCYAIVAAKESARLLRNAAFRLFITARAIWAPTAMGVAALVLDAQGRVLLVRHGYNPGWRLPGGGVGRGEPPADAVLRELAGRSGARPAAAPALSRSIPARPAGRPWWWRFIVSRAASVNFRPNLEIREICFADPRQPPRRLDARNLAPAGGVYRRAPGFALLVSLPFARPDG